MGVSVAVGDLASGAAAFVCNRDGRPPRPLGPGVHGVSNGELFWCCVAIYPPPLCLALFPAPAAACLRVQEPQPLYEPPMKLINAMPAGFLGEWPKVTGGMAQLRQILEESQADVAGE